MFRVARATFHIPTLELGRTAARTMHSLVEHHEAAPARTVLLGSLVQRGSASSP
ncbi:substrate-binding domain-containing protein [Phytoactinopolyspora endophytica]|uniref:substrate-binding domain-containing protein n=1 Tax=Phytoactinopolyspora endophytica TaxID=1642495 RepID=UPI00101C9801